MSQSEAYEIRDEGNAFSDISDEASEVFPGTKEQGSASPTNQWLELSPGTQGTGTPATHLVNNQGFLQIRKTPK